LPVYSTTERLSRPRRLKSLQSGLGQAKPPKAGLATAARARRFPAIAELRAQGSQCQRFNPTE
jgi:hypothetical protein